MMLRCAIVDDEPLALSLLESYVNKTPFLQLVGKYSSAVQAMKELPGEEVDLLFLDIQMPELNGLEFSKMVDPHTRIVFTTAFGQYAIDGYRVNALDYLLKPISYVDFLQAANKACLLYTSSCIDYAKEQNITIRKNRITAASTQIDVKTAKAALFPSLSFSTCLLYTSQSDNRNHHLSKQKATMLLIRKSPQF